MWNDGSSLIAMRKKPFCERIKEARGELTQEALARRVGGALTQKHIERMENRRDGWRSYYTAQIAEATGVNPMWLATGDGEKYLPKDVAVEALALGAAWHFIKDETLRDRVAVDVLAVGLSFMPTTHPLFKTADKLYRESAKRRGIKAQLQES